MRTKCSNNNNDTNLNTFYRQRSKLLSRSVFWGLSKGLSRIVSVSKSISKQEIKRNRLSLEVTIRLEMVLITGEDDLVLISTIIHTISADYSNDYQFIKAGGGGVARLPGSV